MDRPDPQNEAISLRTKPFPLERSHSPLDRSPTDLAGQLRLPAPDPRSTSQRGSDDPVNQLAYEKSRKKGEDFQAIWDFR